MDEKKERFDAERRDERGPRELEKATKEQPWQNSLGMKFVPVDGTQVLFNIWDTRLEDFHAFVESAGYDATEGMYSIGKDGWKRRGATWKEPGFKQGPMNPVVGVGRCESVLRMADQARTRFWCAARELALQAADRH